MTDRYPRADKAEARLQPLAATQNLLSEGPPPDGGPRLSERQALWITFRIESRSDDEATRRYNKSLVSSQAGELEPLEVAVWRQDPEFAEFLDVIPRSKKRAFTMLTENLLPAAYRAIFALITADKDWGRKHGVELLLKIHGLLIDRTQRDDSGELAQLIKMLRTTVESPVVNVYSPGEIVEGQVRQLPPGDSGD